jgi:GTP diphosphokinase / guanosine-3',5'-bis(diphosphate) 3'-diphosphatase
MEQNQSVDELRVLIQASVPELVQRFNGVQSALSRLEPSGTSRLIEMVLTAMRETGVNAHGAIAMLAAALPDKLLEDLVSAEPQIMKIVHGIKAVQILNTSKANIQSENFMKLLLLLSEDMQALLAVKGIKIWQLRHHDLLDPAALKQLVADLEHLYLPLAHRLGLYAVKSEMEDFVMHHKFPEICQSIANALRVSEKSRLTYIQSFINPIRTRLLAHGFDAEIKFRIKTIASIWKKMQAQKVGVEEVYDVFAIRIIDKGPEETGKIRCWEIYSVITDIYKPDPERLRDWISVPRPSGYESLHTTVLGPDDRWVEVQIRTSRMDQEAEHGPAAHWRYKEGKRKGADDWLLKARALIERQTSGSRPAQEGSHAAKIMDEIFTITPAGDLIRLKPGATILDFAFEVHTEVGIRCKGGMVNGKIMPIRHKLSNGDKVEIITSPHPNVSEDWLKIVVSSKAKTRIRKALQEKNEQDIAAGREVLDRKLRQWKVGALDDHLGHLMHYFKIKDVAVLYRMIATERITTAQIKELIESHESPKAPLQKSKLKTELAAHQFPLSEEVMLINDEMETTNYHLAQCCKPVYGDDIFGFITVGKGIRIHRNNCPNAPDMKIRYPYRVIATRWSGKSDSTSLNVTVQVSGKDKLGIVNEITDLISNDMKVMMRSVSFESSHGKFKGTMNLHVKDASHIEWILRKITLIDGVEKASRLKTPRY